MFQKAIRYFKSFPIRQQILLVVAVTVGLMLVLGAVLSLFQPDTLNLLIVIYGLSFPMILLLSDALIDLNDRRVFLSWLLIAVIQLIFRLATSGKSKYFIRNSNDFEKSLGIDKPAGHYATSCLKTLFIFLLSYWVLDKLLYRKGFSVVNTFRQGSWYHDEARRRITVTDVMVNIILYLVYGACILI